MKKIFRNIIIVFIFVATLSLAACNKTEKGCKHTYSDYFRLEECEKCHEIGRKNGSRLYDNEIKYTLKNDDIESFKANFEAFSKEIEKLGKYNSETDVFVKDSEKYKKEEKFEEDFYNKIVDDYEICSEQYQYARIREDMDTDDTQAKKNFDEVSLVLNDCEERYYKAFRMIYETEYRDYFFSQEDGWDEESINQALYMSDIRGNKEYSDLNKENDDLLSQFRAIDDIDSNEVLDLYEKFFENNKNLAKLENKESYSELAYEFTYGREYSPKDILAIKDEIKKVSLQFVKYLKKQKSYAISTSERKIFNAILDGSPLNNQVANNYVSDFFKAMNYKNNDFEVDFNKTVNELFETGAYFEGNYDGAYSWTVGRNALPIVFFGPASYNKTFTFVHEFGHHNNACVTNFSEYQSDSFDLDETHSQGDEMMLLNYLRTTDLNVNLVNKLAQDEIDNLMFTIIIATCVDLFEQSIYTNTYTYSGSTQIMADGKITKNEYDDCFKGIMYSFGVGELLNPSYWRYVCMESPCYYISYAISGIESIQLYLIGEEKGFEAAKNSYMHLLDYVTLEQEMNYKEILEYAQMKTYMDKELYTMLTNYLISQMK